MELTVKDAKAAISDIYSAFTNNGYVLDSESPIGLRLDDEGKPARILVNDLFTSTDATRFIPLVIQHVVREALEPALLISANCFQTIQAPPGVTVQIGAVGAMEAGIVAEGGEYPTKDIDMDGGDMVGLGVTKHGLMVRLTEEVVAQSQWDVIGLWLRAAGRAQ